MSNRQKLPRGRRPALGGDMGSMSLTLARSFRRHCSDCGSQRIEWLGLGDAIDVLGVEFVNEVLTAFEVGDQAQSADLDFWRCLGCGHKGCMGPAA